MNRPILALHGLFAAFALVVGLSIQAGERQSVDLPLALDAQLDQLFSELKAAPDESTAREIEQKIWMLWIHPQNPELRILMEKALNARRWYDYRSALGILNMVVQRWPGYSEGWNQRATIHFLMENYQDSLWDIAKTLEQEPRHFGALAGRALIRLRQGKSALAIQNIHKAMEYNPFIRERRLLPAGFTY